MKKIILLIGNVTFEGFVKEELTLFNNPNAIKKALVHEIECLVECNSSEEAEKLGEEALVFCFDSYLIPSVFEGSYINNGGDNKDVEIVYECQNNNRPISIKNFREDYLT